MRRSHNRYYISGPNLSPLPLRPCPPKTLTFAGLPVRLQHEAHRAAAVDARRCIVALTVAAPVVNSTGLCLGGRWEMVSWLSARRSPKREGIGGSTEAQGKALASLCFRRSIKWRLPAPFLPSLPPPSPHKYSQAVHFPAPYLIETRWTAVRQVQARAVRQECAEGVEEVERGGRREGWKLSKGGPRRQGSRRDNRSFLLFPPTISLAGGGSWWDNPGKSEPGDS